jgi:hypothetical protein
MVATGVEHEKIVPTKPELEATTVDAHHAYVPVPYPQTQYHAQSPHPGTHELYGAAGVAAAPSIRTSELSDRNQLSHPQELPTNGNVPPTHELSDHDRWSNAHELSTTGTTSPAHEMSSDGRSVHVGDPTEQLRARRAAIAKEQERLLRMEMLREEDERLEREIEEIERVRRG